MILVLFLHRFLLRTIFGQIEADVMDAGSDLFFDLGDILSVSRCV